jgi:hypothetical protein
MVGLVPIGANGKQREMFSSERATARVVVG